MKKGRWLMLLAVCMLSGCVRGPLPERAAWPWETSRDYEKMQTGGYIGMRGNVANFDEPPKALQPVTPEAVKVTVPEPTASMNPAANKPQLPQGSAESEVGLEKKNAKAKNEYDFSVRDVKILPPTYLPANSVRSSFEITALNHGNAPVSVSIGIDPESSQNISPDKTLPANFVVKPDSDQALVRIEQKVKGEGFKFRTTYSWSIGDYTASHNCPEHYQYPISKGVKAFASVGADSNDSSNSRFFSMPAGSTVLAARKGTVVQIKQGRVNILHDDSTIGTYFLVGKISEEIYVGKRVTTEDVIGVVGTTINNQEGYLRLTVWRPEPLPVTSLKAVSASGGFDMVSFPLEFCSADLSQCRILTKDQAVSRESLSGASKQGSRRKNKGRTSKAEQL